MRRGRIGHLHLQRKGYVLKGTAELADEAREGRLALDVVRPGDSDVIHDPDGADFLQQFEPVGRTDDIDLRHQSQVAIELRDRVGKGLRGATIGNPYAGAKADESSGAKNRKPLPKR